MKSSALQIHTFFFCCLSVSFPSLLILSSAPVFYFHIPISLAGPLRLRAEGIKFLFFFLFPLCFLQSLQFLRRV